MLLCETMDGSTARRSKPTYGASRMVPGIEALASVSERRVGVRPAVLILAGLPQADAIACRTLRGIASSLFGFDTWNPWWMTLGVASILLAFAGVRLPKRPSPLDALERRHMKSE